MNTLKPVRWTPEAFFAWAETQEARYELVDGFPRLMARAMRIHNAIAVNILAALTPRLRGKTCQPFNGDDSVETFPGQIRCPDAGIYCGAWEPNAYIVPDPRVIFEIFSPSTRKDDTGEKLEEYRNVPSIQQILLVEPGRPDIISWNRGQDQLWSDQRLAGLDAVLELPSVELTLPLAEVYADIAFTS